jgi:Flp pilus assembly protein TadB
VAVVVVAEVLAVLMAAPASSSSSTQYLLKPYLHLQHLLLGLLLLGLRALIFWLLLAVVVVLGAVAVLVVYLYSREDRLRKEQATQLQSVLEVRQGQIASLEPLEQTQFLTP